MKPARAAGMARSGFERKAIGVVAVAAVACVLAGCGHHSPASFFRGPASVAFIRATCPTVNMTMASSST